MAPQLIYQYRVTSVMFFLVPVKFSRFLYKDEKFNEERKRRRVAEAERDAYLNFFTERDLEKYKERFFKNLAESEITDSRKGSGSDG